MRSSASRSFRAKEDPAIDADRELVALGAANLGGGLFGAYGTGGGLSQTAVNDDAGAKTQLPSLIVVAVTVIVLVLLTDVLRYIPEAVLGASDLPLDHVANAELAARIGTAAAASGEAGRGPARDHLAAGAARQECRDFVL